MKETIRHFPERKLYVKARGRPPGQMGSCVMIFDEDAIKEGAQERYPWKLTWLGENKQESDMAFYATSIHENIIGPGISRCEYGGFLLSYPPRRMLDVWHDPDYLEFSAKPDLLLAASIDYSVKPVIVYVGPKPPSAALHAYARRQGKRILFLPMSTLPRTELKRLRTFHVLDGHEKRKIADEYIL